MVNYTIYEIKCKDETVTSNYVGRTLNFRQRISHHKKPKNNKLQSMFYNYPLYKCIRENKGWDNWIIQPIEILKNSNSDEAVEREQYWIEEKCADLNQINAYDKDENRRKTSKLKYSKNKQKKTTMLIENICARYKCANPDKNIDKNIDINEVIEFVKNNMN